MYKAFKLNGNELHDYAKESNIDYKSLGELAFNEGGKIVEENLNNIKNRKGVIDGTKLSNNWFPQIKADVFISHSHKDYDAALELAGILSEGGLIPFIDSCVWGYADVLLEAIDEKYCKDDNDSQYYNYQKRNYSTSHVHMMLTIALTKMIYHTECIMFLETPNSIYPRNDIPNKCTKTTLSPWIYAEMEMTNLLTQRTLEEHRTEEFVENLKIAHTAKTKNIEPLQISDLIKWSKKNYKSNEAALDALYYIQQNNKKMRKLFMD